MEAATPASPRPATTFAALFPPSSASSPRASRAAAAIAALLVLGAVLNLLRLGWSDSLNTVWAEDGPIYLQAALDHGFWPAVSSPYAGYLVVVPRLIAELGTVVPLADAAAAISVLSALIAALSGLVVWFAAAGQIANPYLRGALVLATVLAATAGQETLASAAYVPWFMLIAAFWLLFLRPRTTLGAILGALFLLATGLSTPGLWFFVPVALLRSFATANRRDAILLAGFGLGAAAQVPVLIAQQQGPALWTSHIWTAYLQRVVEGGVFGQRLGGNLWEHLGWGFLLALCVALVVGLIVGLVRTTANARWFAALAIPTSLLMFVFSVYQRGAGETIFWPAGISGGAASRYALVPALLLLSSALAIVDGVAIRQRVTPARWIAGVAIATIALAIVTSFDMTSPERGRPYWDEALRGAAGRCLSGDHQTAGIPTAPPPFGIQVPCADIASYASSGRI